MTKQLKKALEHFDEVLDSTTGLSALEAVNLKNAVDEIAAIVENSKKQKKKETLEYVVKLFRKHCLPDVQLGIMGDEGESLAGFTIQVLADEPDFNVMCEILGIDVESLDYE